MGHCTVRAPTIIPQDYMAAKAEGYDAEEACRFASRYPVTYHCEGCGEHPSFPAWIESQRKPRRVSAEEIIVVDPIKVTSG
jgi:hypothetical protein